jgi:hypothetical protein
MAPSSQAEASQTVRPLAFISSPFRYSFDHRLEFREGESDGEIYTREIRSEKERGKGEERRGRSNETLPFVS